MTAMPAKAEQIRYLLKSIIKSEPDENQDLVDQYVELELAGEDCPPELEQLKEHLEWCGCCQKVLESIKAAITCPEDEA